MKKTYGWIILFLTFSLILGCASDQSLTPGTYSFGVTFTHNLREESEIRFYSEEGSLVKKISINHGGLKEGKVYQNKLYIPVTGVPKAIDHKVLEVDLETFHIRYLDTDVLPVSLAVDDQYVYVLHNSKLKTGSLTKINIKENRIEKKIELEGQFGWGRIYVDKDDVFVAVDQVFEKRQIIYKLNKNLELKGQIINKQYSAPTDMRVIDGTLYLITRSKRDPLEWRITGPANQLIEVKLNQFDKLIMESLNTPSPHRIFESDDQILITHDRIPTGSKITMIDKKTREQKTVTVTDQLPVCTVKDNKLYGISDFQFSLYEMDDFKKIKTYDLNPKKEYQVVDLFVK
ncbi:exported hypothetical protein [[Clostridium] ultunense Esp]|uniref:hypothetical protein n=1 Tax=Thermicanus aegyptius TaxID=94009 RepID=UPI0002B70144|nr:hypothetical protein [Thermicanus aegyptius]CCQ93834.1 exported hypothetical protein [[Clostridium] ultunense Esp]